LCSSRNYTKNTIHNFNLLDENNIYQITKNNGTQFQLFGIGGNFLVGGKLLQKPIAGQSGKVWATLHQFGVLYKQLEKKSKSSIFVSHVSPGKEPLLTRLMLHYMPTLWISGHMGAPYTNVWNQLTTREMDESLKWLESDMEIIDALPTKQLTPEAKIAYDILKREIPREDFWFRKMWNINLSDLKRQLHCNLRQQSTRFFSLSISSCSFFLKIRHCAVVTRHIFGVKIIIATNTPTASNRQAELSH
jgi:hypothetical protein